MNQDLILETRGLVKEFRGFTGVDDVNLKVARGTIHALIGPNGAKKTIVFNLLTKLLTPTRGKFLFNGQDITRKGSASIAHMWIVRSFQISAVFPHLTVLENVRVALQQKRNDTFALKVKGPESSMASSKCWLWLESCAPAPTSCCLMKSRNTAIWSWKSKPTN